MAQLSTRRETGLNEMIKRFEHHAQDVCSNPEEAKKVIEQCFSSSWWTDHPWPCSWPLRKTQLTLRRITRSTWEHHTAHFSVDFGRTAAALVRGLGDWKKLMHTRLAFELPPSDGCLPMTCVRNCTIINLTYARMHQQGTPRPSHPSRCIPTIESSRILSNYSPFFFYSKRLSPNPRKRSFNRDLPHYNMNENIEGYGAIPENEIQKPPLIGMGRVNPRQWAFSEMLHIHHVHVNGAMLKTVQVQTGDPLTFPFPTELWTVNKSRPLKNGYCAVTSTKNSKSFMVANFLTY